MRGEREESQTTCTTVGPRYALNITALRAKIGNVGGIVLPLLAEWKLERCALKLLWCFALKISVIYFRVEDSLIFMCAAHGKKYGSFPLTKLHLKVPKSLLTQEIWVGAWDSFAFFFWKNGPRNGGLMVKNGSFGTVLRFFQTTINDK